MSDAGGPGSARKCPGLALADLGDTEGFEKDGEENQLYAFQLSDGVYKRKKVVTQEGGGAQKLSELSDVDVSYAAPRRLHTLAFTGSSWVAFADPVQETGWVVDVKVSEPYVVTGREHKVRKVTNAGTRLCSYVPETKNVVVSKRYTLGTGAGRAFLKWFRPGGNHRRRIAHDPPRASPVRQARRLHRCFTGFTLKWTQAHVNKEVGVYIRVREPPQMRFTLQGIGFQTDYRLLDISKIHVGPAVELKRLRFTPLDLSSDQSSVMLSHLKLSDSSDNVRP